MLPSLFKGRYSKTLQINTKCHWLYTVKVYFSLMSQSWGLQQWLGDADSASRPAGHQGRGGRKHGVGTCGHATSAHTSLLTVGALISRTAREAEGGLSACQWALTVASPQRWGRREGACDHHHHHQKPPSHERDKHLGVYHQSLDLKFYKWCQPHSCFGILTYLLQGAKKAKPYLAANPEGCCLHRKELFPPTLTCSGSEACSLLGESPGWVHVHSSA